MIGSIALLSVLLISQTAPVPYANAFAPDPAGSWHQVEMGGKTALVWGTKDANGWVRFVPNAQPPSPPVESPEESTATLTGRPFYQTNGVSADKLATDSRVVRASDPETLQMVMESNAKPCNPFDDPPDWPTPGLFSGLMGGIERGVWLAVAAIVALVAVVVFMQGRRPSS